MNDQRFKILLLALSLTIAFSANYSVRLQRGFPESDSNFHRPLLLQFVPERLRAFVAGYLWTMAESLMHRGPVPFVNEKFIAGSYAGNTDIVPLLKAAILFMPEELVPYQMLASNLAKYLGKPEAGLRVIQQGIVSNREHPGIHELYGAAAFLLLFDWHPIDDARRISVLKYLDRATEYWNEESERFSSDPAFKPQNYAFLKARLLVELKRPQEALAAWQASELDLDSAPDKLAEVLRAYRDSGRVPQAEDFPAMSTDETVGDGAQTDKLPENKVPALPASAMLRLLFGAAMLLLTSIAASKLFQKSAKTLAQK